MRIDRRALRERLERALIRSPVVALMGPRQCGKTTLAADLMARQRPSVRFDLENPRDDARLREPLTALEGLKGLAVLDEIQRRPDLMPILRVLADRRPRRCRFLLLGSASPELVRRSSETLAGRVEFVEMAGFSLLETGAGTQDALWNRGGFPPAFLARTNAESFAWRENFISTFLERDIPQLEIRIPAAQLRRFWTMLAHVHAQTWNASEIAASMGISHPTARRYLDLLTGAFMIRQLPPWFANVGKRVVKAPKVYLRDSGLLHALLGLADRRDLLAHPKYGSSWEGFALEQILRVSGDRHAYFWATHAGAELDLLLVKGGRRLGFEFKCSEAPVATKSMHIARHDLELDRLWVVYPGRARYSPASGIECLPLGEALESFPAHR